MKSRTHFVCQACGSQAQKWLGRCPECAAWGSFEERSDPAASSPAGTGADPLPLAEVRTALDRRDSTGIQELDRVLGGGLVPGAVVLVGGEPGIGKSTLLLQAAAAVAAEERQVG